MGTAEIVQLGLILARLAERAIVSSDNATAKKALGLSAALFAGYATAGRVDAAVAAEVKALGATLDALNGPISKATWDASAAETKRVTAKWNAAGKA